MRTARVESRRNAGLDHFWFLFFKPVSVHWLGGGGTPTNESDQPSNAQRFYSRRSQRIGLSETVTRNGVTSRFQEVHEHCMNITSCSSSILMATVCFGATRLDDTQEMIIEQCICASNSLVYHSRGLPPKQGEITIHECTVLSQELLKIAEIVTLRSDRSRTGSVGRATVGLNNFRVSHGGVQGRVFTVP